MRYLIYTLILLIGVCTVANASNHYVQIQDEAKLYYEELGSGQTIVFIPGWTFSHHVFDRQTKYFSRNYHIIAVDPRGQGLSSITLENNNYDQHGKDLANLIDKLQLKHIILVGWSAGCFDAYAYIREKGVSNLKAFVCIDAPPKGTGSNAWKAPSAVHNGADIMRELEHDRYDFTYKFAQSMVDHQLSSYELNWLVSQSLRTPTFISLLLLFDAINADYQPEAIQLEKIGIPTLNIVASPMGKNATAWIKVNAPHSKVIIFGKKHMMFWEYANELNKTLDNFFISLDKK